MGAVAVPVLVIPVPVPTLSTPVFSRMGAVAVPVLVRPVPVTARERIPLFEMFTVPEDEETAKGGVAVMLVTPPVAVEAMVTAPIPEDGVKVMLEPAINCDTAPPPDPVLFARLLISNAVLHVLAPLSFVLIYYYSIK